MRILVPLGTRPEIVKLAPVVRELIRRGHDVTTIATGQHYDANLTDSFFEELQLTPQVRWTLPSGEGARVAAVLQGAFDVLGAERPDLLLVLGDTYTVPLFCLAARRYAVPLAHLEAGLRSFNETSMEETNRKVAAVSARLHFAPTALAARFLEREGVDPDRIKVVGNPVIDVLRSRGVTARPLAERLGVLVTAHRPTNVDDPVRLAALVEIIRRLAAEVGPVTFPVHPRTAARLEESGLSDALRAPGVSAVDPLGYDDMLEAMRSSRVVVTDSGGVQEEAAYLGVPVVVLRRSTPRWEGVELGIAALSGVEPDRVLRLASTFADPAEQARIAAVPCPYGVGDTAIQVADALEDPAVLALLPITEPDLVDWLPR